MFNILGRIFGTDKAIEKGIDTISNGLDKLVYTKEEQAEDKAKAATEFRGMLIGWFEASQGQRLARRVIALSVTFVWLFQYLAAMVMSIASVWAEEPRLYTRTAEVIGDYADAMNGAVMLILAFYFAAPHIGEIVGPAIEKFSKRPAASKGV